MIKQCLYCQNDFYVKPAVHRYGTGKYCSRNCQHSHRIGRQEFFFKNISHEPHPDGCWIWIGLRNRTNYGRIVIDYRDWNTHRYSWVLHFGEIPEGMCVCHHCDNPPCNNPDHLFLGTHRDNARDRQKKNRGTKLRGSECAIAKLTEDKVLDIRKRLASGEPNHAVAKEYNVSPMLTSSIKLRKIWKHI